MGFEDTRDDAEAAMQQQLSRSEVDHDDAKLAQLDPWEKIKELEKENKELEEAAKQKDEKIKELDEKHSVRDILKTTPSMTIKKSCSPSIIDNNKAHKMVDCFRRELLKWQNRPDNDKGDKPTRFKFHEPAEIHIKPLPKGCLESVKINLKDGDDNLIKSNLSLTADGPSPHLPHDNETSPQTYLSDALKDVIRCSGIGARVIMEASLFSYRPDLVVVVYEGHLLFVIEVKNPGKDVMAAETAYGQILDYLKGLKQSGVDQPFALLSTYNESVIVRLNENDELYAEHLNAGSKNMKELAEKRHQRKGCSEEEKPPTSPAKTQFSDLKLDSLSAEKSNQTDAMEVDEDPEAEDAMEVENSDDGKYDYRGRAVACSQKFGVKDLYKVLALLLESSLVAADASRESIKALVPNEGSQMKDIELCTLHKDYCDYRRVNIKCVSYNSPPRFAKDQQFHVLCALGQGGKGRCILCCSTSGKMFVAKLLLFKPSVKFSAEDRDKENEELKLQKMEAAEDEKGRWLKLAPKECHKYCKVLELNGMPALTMPFFPPLPMDKRRDALTLIHTRLKNLAHEGYVYAGSDLRWRHFGHRWTENNEMEVIPLDLGSLEKLETNGDIFNIVNSQIDELEGRMGEEQIQPKNVFV